MDFSNNITKQLQGDEGLRLQPYLDSRGIETIGYGRNLRDNGITEKEALWMLWNDIELVQNWIRAHWSWTLHLDDARLGVLVNMGFNIGIPGLCEFRKMLAAVQAGDFETAAKEMENSSWYVQVGARAHRLVTQMRTGVWQYAQ